jgi:hypothetical protein
MRLPAILDKSPEATESARPEVLTAFGRVHRAVAILHFLRVTRSYWTGLLARYDQGGSPRTKDEPEQLLGSYRHHERRARGREVVSPGSVVRGPVRLVSATATQ